jgi:protein ImuB
MKSLWIYLHFPQLQLDTLLAQHNGTGTMALVIVEQPQIQVAQLNSVAMKTGIREGMSLAAATTLCQDLQVYPYQKKVEEDKLKEVADKLYKFTSDICFFSETGLLLRVHTMLKLYENLETYWLAIQHQLADMNITYHYGSALTPFAAKLLASDNWDQVTQDRLQIQQRLMHCSLQSTELDNKTVKKLNRVGLRRLQQLIEIPLSDIAKRFTHDVAEYLGRLSGALSHPVTFYHPTSHFERYMELLYEISSRQTLIHPLGYLLKAMEQFLILRDQLTIQVNVCLYQRDREAFDFNVGTKQGEYRADVWQRLIELQLENVILKAPVIALTLKSTGTQACVPETSDLFTSKQGRLTRLQLMALLQAKLGEQAVFNPVFVNDHRPEKASQDTNTLQTSHSINIGIPQSMRPIFLLPRPRRLAEQVNIEHGPERVQTGWWDGASIERDYFIARTPQGQWYWVFRTPQQQWFLHGVFS